MLIKENIRIYRDMKYARTLIESVKEGKISVTLFKQLVHNNVVKHIFFPTLFTHREKDKDLCAIINVLRGVKPHNYSIIMIFNLINGQTYHVALNDKHVTTEDVKNHFNIWKEDLIKSSRGNNRVMKVLVAKNYMFELPKINLENSVFEPYITLIPYVNYDKSYLPEPLKLMIKYLTPSTSYELVIVNMFALIYFLKEQYKLNKLLIEEDSVKYTVLIKPYLKDIPIFSEVKNKSVKKVRKTESK